MLHGGAGRLGPVAERRGLIEPLSMQPDASSAGLAEHRRVHDLERPRAHAAERRRRMLARLMDGPHDVLVAAWRGQPCLESRWQDYGWGVWYVATAIRARSRRVSRSPCRVQLETFRVSG